MTKRQLIDQIMSINRTAEPGFLAGFDDRDLGDYLQHLRQARSPRLSGDTHRYDHYFENCPAVALAEAAATDGEAACRTVQSEEDHFDLNVSQDAYFNESYDALALEEQAHRLAGGDDPSSGTAARRAEAKTSSMRSGKDRRLRRVQLR